MMSGIRGGNTKPEVTLRKALHHLGFRYRLHGRKLPGRPDIVLPKYRAVILVHGCFWHRHAHCHYCTTPGTNAEFWAAKFTENTTRDARNLEDLRKAGWRTAIVWECAMRHNPADVVAGIIGGWLRSSSDHLEIPQPGSNTRLRLIS